MAIGAQSITEALVGRAEGVPQLHATGLGVSPLALDVFSNFVTHIAATTLPTGAVCENLQASGRQPRRSSRYGPHNEAPDTCQLAVPVPPEPEVRFVATVSSVDGRQLGFSAQSPRF